MADIPELGLHKEPLLVLKYSQHNFTTFISGFIVKVNHRSCEITTNDKMKDGMEAEELILNVRISRVRSHQHAHATYAQQATPCYVSNHRRQLRKTN